nr:type II toxin-antitoxin system YafQ family toxin [Acutalibacter muris]
MAQKRNLNIRLLEEVVAILSMGKDLPEKNRDHSLSGNWAGYRGCHILPDWLLVLPPNKNIGNLIMLKESGDLIRRML